MKFISKHNNMRRVDRYSPWLRVLDDDMMKSVADLLSLELSGRPGLMTNFKQKLIQFSRFSRTEVQEERFRILLLVDLMFFPNTMVRWNETQFQSWTNRILAYGNMSPGIVRELSKPNSTWTKIGGRDSLTKLQETISFRRVLSWIEKPKKTKVSCLRSKRSRV